MSNIISKINLNGTDNFIASSSYGVCSTASNTVNKIVSLQNGSSFTLIDGVTIHVKFNNSNTISSPTLNVNNTGAKNILNPGGNGDLQWPANSVLSLTYYNNNYYINGFFKPSTGGEGGQDILPAIDVANISTTEKSVGSINRYAKEDHVHQLAVATGQQNGYVQIGNSQVQVKGIAAAAFRDSTDIIDTNNQNKVPTANAVINYITNQIPQVPALSTNISADSTSNTKATTPKAVVDYIDQAISGLSPGGDSGIVLSNNIANEPTNRNKATTPYAVVQYIDGKISDNISTDATSHNKMTTPYSVVQYVQNALDNFDPGEGGSNIQLSDNISADATSHNKATTPYSVVQYVQNALDNFDPGEETNDPAFSYIRSNGTENEIEASSDSGGNIFNINAGALTSVTLTPNTRTVTIGSTLTSQQAMPNGTTLSLVTTGEKYLWNNVSQATGGITFGVFQDQDSPSGVYGLTLLADDAEGPDGMNYYYSGYSNGNLSFGDPNYNAGG